MKLLLLTPPFVQTNTPYPATMHLAGYLRMRGYDVEQRDLSIKVVRDILVEYGGGDAEELLELLSGDAPPEAKTGASGYMDELAEWIRDNVDGSFGFSRYAERIGASASDFGSVERLVRRKGVMDAPLERRLAEAMEETRPDVVGVTRPFPGTLVGAFKIARWIRRRMPGVRIYLGGGFVSTELREMDDSRAKKYFDGFLLDEGYAPVERILAGVDATCRDTPPFVCPDYSGIDWSEYFDVVETENPMHRLWSVGRWRKLQMARGCYWRKCAFCDVILPYINCFEQPDAREIVDAMETLGGDCHFVDEAMPPALVRRVSEEILLRGVKCRWWGNVRFDKSYTKDLCRLMAKAGCIAVTGGLECANDRLLELMNKGITLDGARRAMKAFKSAGIMVHAYLMYGFPTETETEAMGALDYVRGLVAEDLVQSAFWHRFALTCHSPVAKDPDRFGIVPRPPPRRKGRVFAVNEIPFDEPGAPDWDRIGEVLRLAMYNFMEGRGLDKDSAWWKRRSGVSLNF